MNSPLRYSGCLPYTFRAITHHLSPTILPSTRSRLLTHQTITPPIRKGRGVLPAMFREDDLPRPSRETHHCASPDYTRCSCGARGRARQRLASFPRATALHHCCALSLYSMVNWTLLQICSRVMPDKRKARDRREGRVRAFRRSTRGAVPLSYSTRCGSFLTNPGVSPPPLAVRR